MKSVLSLVLLLLATQEVFAQINGDYFCEVAPIFESEDSEGEDSNSKDEEIDESYISRFGIRIANNGITIYNSSHSMTEYLFGDWTLITHKNGALRTNEYESQVYKATKKITSVEIIEAKVDQSITLSRVFSIAENNTLSVVGADTIKYDSNEDNDSAQEDKEESESTVQYEGFCIPTDFKN